MKWNLHFNLPASRAALVDIVSKHVSPKHVLGGDGNEQNCTAKARHTHSKVDEDGAQEARVDGKKIEQQQVGREHNESQHSELAPLDVEHGRIPIVVIDPGGRVLLVRRSNSRLGGGAAAAATTSDFRVRHSQKPCYKTERVDTAEKP